MNINNKKKNNFNFFIPIFITFIFFSLMLQYIFDVIEDEDYTSSFNKTLTILSSFENNIVEKEIVEYGKKNKVDIEMVYMGDLDIVDELNYNSSDYDAVWISNSMWLYMLNNSYLTSNSKSVSISPVVFGIKKSKATELGLVDGDVDNTKILNLIKDKKIKYVMPSVTQTNSGATAYLGFLTSLAGNPEMLTEDMLDNEKLIDNLKTVFSGVERVSGDEKYLEEMFISGGDYEAIIASEASLININKTLKTNKKEELYLIYPSDGVAINDSAFALINGEKEDEFLNIQSYLLSEEGQDLLAEKGLRTWYGGVSDKVDKTTFNKDWGIDTTKYLSVTKFPSKSVITKAINLYIETLRKPTHVVFCLDYSGSMYGNGINELTSAMDYILDYEKAKKDKLQFSKNDKITIITFSSKVNSIWSSTGHDTSDLINNINNEEVTGTTALYDAIIKGISILDEESDEYTKTIIAMTDGSVNVGKVSDLYKAYNQAKNKIPVYSITFGSADERQLNEIAQFTNSKVFNGKINLLKAFKEVRGYN